MLLSLRTNYLSFMPLLTGLAGYLEERGMRTIVCITSFAADRGGQLYLRICKNECIRLHGWIAGLVIIEWITRAELQVEYGRYSNDGTHGKRALVASPQAVAVGIVNAIQKKVYGLRNHLLENHHMFLFYFYINSLPSPT